MPRKGEKMSKEQKARISAGRKTHIAQKKPLKEEFILAERVSYEIARAKEILTTDMQCQKQLAGDAALASLFGEDKAASERTALIAHTRASAYEYALEVIRRMENELPQHTLMLSAEQIVVSAEKTP